MKPLKPDEKKLLGICVLLIIVTVVGAVALPRLGLLARVREATTARGQLLEMQDQLEQAKAKEKALPQLRQEIEAAEAKIAQVESRLPNDKQAPEMFQELNDLAGIANQEYLSMEAKPTVEKGAYIEIPFEIKLAADYHDLGRYINMIERSNRFAMIDRLDIEYDFEDPFNQDVTLTVSTFMFVKRSRSRASTGGSPSRTRS